MSLNDTIAAIATPPGEGAIGIIRMSGDESLSILRKIFKSQYNYEVSRETDKKLLYGHIYDGDIIVDEVLTASMFGPNTYTKEDIVEINCHGGIVPIKAILGLILKNGARMAEPGEFTKRAFLNGRLDLAQAESVMDLVSAKTDEGFQIAYSQLEGKLSKKVSETNDKIVSLLANLAVCIDYPEEDIEEITYKEILASLEEIRDDIYLLNENSGAGKILRDGLKTVIVGKPNVGKSSLLNALLKESRAIVTEVAGTTRDVIEEYVNIKGVPIRLVDTAGIRETHDVIEKIGVQRSKESFNKADLVIFVLNAAEELTSDDKEIIELLENKKVIVIINKTDLDQKIDMNFIEERLGDKKIIKTSILNEIGVEDIEKSILDLVYDGEIKSSESVFVSNVRHMDALEKALSAVNDAIRVTSEDMPYDFIEVDIKNIYSYLGEISGDTVEEDLIDKIFSNFCLGK
jgi:tRNA modification GTPase